MMDFWRGKVVLVTGGTGSWGQECVKQLLTLPVEKIIVYSRDEYKQSLLWRRWLDERLRFLLGDIREADRLVLALRGVDVVIHLAGLKQVGAGEYGPMEFVRTNVLGTMRIVETCLHHHIPRALFISSDKAVFPTTLYGGTKFIAEKLWLGGNLYSPAPHWPWFSVARFGNALGSRGSVLDIWREQHRCSTPLTVCDPDHTRFVITLPRALQFCLHCIEDMKGGEVYVPPMEAVRIGDLARAFAGPDYPIEVVGSRGAGEKRSEYITSSLNSDDVTRLEGEELRTLLQQEELL